MGESLGNGLAPSHRLFMGNIYGFLSWGNSELCTHTCSRYHQLVHTHTHLLMCYVLSIIPMCLLFHAKSEVRDAA